jgi:hypothetical protein
MGPNRACRNTASRSHEAQDAQSRQRPRPPRCPCRGERGSITTSPSAMMATVKIMVMVMMVPVMVAIVHLRCATLLGGSGLDRAQRGGRWRGLGHRRGGNECRHRDRNPRDAFHVSSPCVASAATLWARCLSSVAARGSIASTLGSMPIPLRATMKATDA